MASQLRQGGKTGVLGEAGLAPTFSRGGRYSGSPGGGRVVHNFPPKVGDRGSGESGCHGDRLRPVVIGLLANIGVGRISFRPRPSFPRDGPARPSLRTRGGAPRHTPLCVPGRGATPAARVGSRSPALRRPAKRRMQVRARSTPAVARPCRAVGMRWRHTHSARALHSLLRAAGVGQPLADGGCDRRGSDTALDRRSAEAASLDFSLRDVCGPAPHVRCACMPSASSASSEVVQKLLGGFQSFAPGAEVRSNFHPGRPMPAENWPTFSQHRPHVLDWTTFADLWPHFGQMLASIGQHFSQSCRLGPRLANSSRVRK